MLQENTATNLNCRSVWGNKAQQRHAVNSAHFPQKDCLAASFSPSKTPAKQAGRHTINTQAQRCNPMETGH